MLQTLMLRLDPSPADHTRLLQTMERVNAACSTIADVAFREKCVSKVLLQRMLYRQVREQFSLSAQMAVRAIAKVVEAYKRDRTKKPTFRSRGAVPYDQRILSFKSLDAASILTLDGRATVPIRLGDYQRAIVVERPRRGQADLIYRDKTFYLAVVVEAPEATPYDPVGALGVDLGVVNIAADSDGKTYA
ncbi:transposase, IS605 OrfB family, partial [mine drainage metagenome]